MPGPRGVPGLVGVRSEGCLVETPRDGYCCGRYASYWNAFLFTIDFNAKKNFHDGRAHHSELHSDGFLSIYSSWTQISEFIEISSQYTEVVEAQWPIVGDQFKSVKLLNGCNFRSVR